MKKSAPESSVSEERPRRRFGFGGGSLAISLLFHGLLVALGVFWILKVIPEPEDKGFDVPVAGRSGSDSRPTLKPSKTTAPFRDAASAAAVGVTGAIVLPEMDSSGQLSKLGPIGGGPLKTTTDVIACPDFHDNGFLDYLVKSGSIVFPADARAQRIAYVIDFSQSMRADGRDELMRAELSRSVDALASTTKYQLIFFSGPAWVTGDEVRGNKVVHNGKEYEWSSKSLWEWAPVGPMMKAGWEAASDSQKRKSIQLIRETELVGGTDWESPLKMAMAMEPPPEQIFFMTDGSMENRDMNRLVRGLAATAKSKNIRINTVNMMVPQKDANDAMKNLAEKTGGTFTIVEKGGKVRRGK